MERSSIVQHNTWHNEWNFDPLITYRINSFSIFYIGSTHSYEHLSMTDGEHEKWTLADRQFFMKLQYLFQI